MHFYVCIFDLNFLKKLSRRQNNHVTDGQLHIVGFPGSSEVKASACNVGDLGSIPGL